jgi:hypothetical protein
LPDSVTRVRNATRIGFFGFPQLARMHVRTNGESLPRARMHDVFVDLMAETHNMIPDGRRVGGFLIFWPLWGRETAFAGWPGHRFRRRI